MRGIWIGIALFVAVGIGAGASELWHRAPPRPRSSKAVATWPGGAISQEEVDAARAGRGQIDERKLIQDLVRRRVLATRARAEGLGEEPAVAGHLEQVLADAYVRRHVDEPLRSAPEDERETAAYFEAHRAEYDRPEQVKLAAILVAAPAEPRARAEKRKIAVALLQQVSAQASKDFYAFGQIARERSDDPATRPFGGELPPATPDELGEKYGPAIRNALSQLHQPNQIAADVVETPQGFLILRLNRRDPAQHATLAQLRPALRSRMAEEKRAASYQKLIEGVDAEGHVVVEAPALSSR